MTVRRERKTTTWRHEHCVLVSMATADEKDPASGVVTGSPNDVSAAPELPSKPRVLVADDDPGLLVAIARVLEHAGAIVRRAENGAELLDALAEGLEYDLIVTDVAMPWMTGLQVAQYARAAGLETPTIVVTGSNDPRLQHLVDALGRRTVLLRKPVDLDVLLEACHQLVSAANWTA